MEGSGVMQQTEKEKNGVCYLYERYCSVEMIKSFSKNAELLSAPLLISSLTAGCLRAESVLYRSEGGICIGGDIFVKDKADAPEWILYGSRDICDPSEEGMLHFLDRMVEENRLSYTECCFEKLSFDAAEWNEKRKKERNFYYEKGAVDHSF